MDEKQNIETIENGDFDTKETLRVAEEDISLEQRQMESRIM